MNETKSVPFDSKVWQGNYLVAIMKDTQTISHGHHGCDTEEEACKELIAVLSEPCLILQWDKVLQEYKVWKQDKWIIIGNKVI